MGGLMMKIWVVCIALLACLESSHAAEGTQDRIDTIQTDARRALLEGRFESIDEMAKQMQLQRSRLADGRWELPFVTSAFVWNIKPRDSSAWETRLQQIDRWIARTPKESTPYLAKAAVLISYAWDARGAGWAETVRNEDWPVFTGRLTAAQHVLEESAAISKTSPIWYDAMQTIALGLSWPENKYSEIFNEAVQREPTYYVFYFNAARYYLPRWHGNDGDVARFVDAAVGGTRDTEGETLYARIYWSLLWAYEDYTFLPGRANWSRMRQGFRDILRVYPDNWNINAFAFYACMAEDWPTYLQAAQQMSSAEPRLWGFGLSPEECSQQGHPSSTPTAVSR
jgi:hypothetical protein